MIGKKIFIELREKDRNLFLNCQNVEQFKM